MDGKTNLNLEKIKESLLLKEFNEHREETYYIESEDPKYYYYKQWMWVQFPWIGQSIKENYSDLINKCLKSPTEHMSVQFEANIIKQVMKIADKAR